MLLRTTDTEWIFIDVSNHSVFPSRQLFPDEYPAEDHAIFFDIILPLYNIASEVHDTNFIKKEALATISKEQLSNFHLNFSRFACCWEPDFLQPFKYAIACMTYKEHLDEARRFIPNTYANATLTLLLNQQIRNQKNMFLVRTLHTMFRNSKLTIIKFSSTSRKTTQRNHEVKPFNMQLECA